MKTALIVCGRNAKGAFLMSVIEVLRHEYGAEFNIVSGTSTGALIAPLVVVAAVSQEAEYRWAR